LAVDDEGAASAKARVDLLVVRLGLVVLRILVAGRELVQVQAERADAERAPEPSRRPLPRLDVFAVDGREAHGTSSRLRPSSRAAGAGRVGSGRPARRRRAG